MRPYWLTVISEVPPNASGRAYLCEVLRIEGAPGIEWVRTHADELAQLHTGRAYVALMVRDAMPVDEAAAIARMAQRTTWRATVVGG